jgi:hypothetical protein
MMHQLNLLAASPFAGQPSRRQELAHEALVARGGINAFWAFWLKFRVRHGSNDGETAVLAFSFSLSSLYLSFVFPLVFPFSLSLLSPYLSPSRYNYLPT